MATRVEDELSAVRESFYAGYYKKTIASLETTYSANEMVETEKECLAARCKHVINGSLTAAELDKLQQSGSPGLEALAGLIKFRQTTKSPAERKEAAEALKRLAESSQDATAKQLAAAALLEIDDYNAALRLLDADTTEMLAAKAQVVLSVDRPDLAEQFAAQLTTSNDDSALAKLVAAWNLIEAGNYQEAYLTFGDLQTLLGGERHGAVDVEYHSPMILNGMAVANMQRRLWAEAIDDLQRSLSACGGGEAEPHTLATLVACYRQSRKHAEADQRYEILKKMAPDHDLVVKAEELDAALNQFHNSTNATR